MSIRMLSESENEVRARVDDEMRQVGEARTFTQAKLKDASVFYANIKVCKNTDISYGYSFMMVIITHPCRLVLT